MSHPAGSRPDARHRESPSSRLPLARPPLRPRSRRVALPPGDGASPQRLPSAGCAGPSGCEDVIISNGAILVGSGHAVDAEAAGSIVIAERVPQAGGLDEQAEAGPLLELSIVCAANVARDGVRDISVNVEGRRARGPVPRTLFARDGAPGEGGAAQPELLRPFFRVGQRGIAPAQRIGGGVRER